MLSPTSIFLPTLDHSSSPKFCWTFLRNKSPMLKWTKPSYLCAIRLAISALFDPGAPKNKLHEHYSSKTITDDQNDRSIIWQAFGETIGSCRYAWRIWGSHAVTAKLFIEATSWFWSWGNWRRRSIICCLRCNACFRSAGGGCLSTASYRLLGFGSGTWSSGWWLTCCLLSRCLTANWGMSTFGFGFFAYSTRLRVCSIEALCRGLLRRIYTTLTIHFVGRYRSWLSSSLGLVRSWRNGWFGSGWLSLIVSRCRLNTKIMSKLFILITWERTPLAVECLDCSWATLCGFWRLFALSAAAILLIRFSRGVVDLNSAAEKIHEFCRIFWKFFTLVCRFNCIPVCTAWSFACGPLRMRRNWSCIAVDSRAFVS